MARRREPDPGLAELVERARSRARDAGELSPAAGQSFAPKLEPEVRREVAAWIREGSYVRAVAEVTTLDPGLADQ